MLSVTAGRSSRSMRIGSRRRTTRKPAHSAPADRRRGWQRSPAPQQVGDGGRHQPASSSSLGAEGNRWRSPRSRSNPVKTLRRESFLGSAFELRIATVASTVKKTSPVPLSVLPSPYQSSSTPLGVLRITRRQHVERADQEGSMANG